MPFSLYGLTSGVEWRWVEHSGWVVFTAAFLVIACLRWQRERADVANRQARLEFINEGLEREVLTPLRGAADGLVGAAGHLMVQMRAQQDALVEQSGALQQANVTAIEIRQTAQAASRLAAEAMRMAGDADAQGQSGEQALALSLAEFESIQTRVREIATEIRLLEGQTRHVGTITGTVRELADRSNMLALNAAIEAVRSGEHGKGFAVVAREMRSLADKSLKSTRDVASVLASIEEAVVTTADSGEVGAAAIEQGLTQVRALSENLRELAGALSFMSRSVKQISATVSQQSVGVDEISSVILRLQTVLEESTRRTGESNEAIDVVERSTVALKRVIEAANAYRSSAAEETFAVENLTRAG